MSSHIKSSYKQLWLRNSNTLINIDEQVINNHGNTEMNRLYIIMDTHFSPAFLSALSYPANAEKKNRTWVIHIKYPNQQTSKV